MPNEVGVYLADLLERHELMPVHRRNRHRPGTPLYDLSIANSRLALAKKCVDTYRKNGMSLDHSVAKAARGIFNPCEFARKLLQGKTWLFQPQEEATSALKSIATRQRFDLAAASLCSVRRP